MPMAADNACSNR